METALPPMNDDCREEARETSCPPQGLGFTGCRVQGAGCRVQGLGFKVQGLGTTKWRPTPHRVWGVGCR